MNKLMTPEEEAIAIQHQAVFGVPTIDRPIPERIETVNYQIQWLKSGKRKCVYLPKGSLQVNVPKGFQMIETQKGGYIYNPNRLTARQILDAENDRKIGDILGYGISEKPTYKDLIGAVVIRDDKGIEKQAVAVDAKHFESAWKAAEALRDETDIIEFENTINVIEKRMNP